jgi:hypothetical protein
VITVDQAALSRSTAKFANAIADRIKQTKMAAEDVLGVEGVRLCEEMIRRTPPKNRSRLEDKIERRVNSKFVGLVTEFGPKENKPDSEGNLWYEYRSDFITGMPPESNKFKTSVEDLYQLFLKGEKQRGLLNVGHKGRQGLRLRYKWTTSRAKVQRLAAKIKEHIGREKASFVPALAQLMFRTHRQVKMPPKWVMRHIDGKQRGTFIDMTQAPELPSFTIISTAKGIGSDLMKVIANAAMKKRAASIARYTIELVKHPELIGKELGIGADAQSE